MEKYYIKKTRQAISYKLAKMRKDAGLLKSPFTIKSGLYPAQVSSVEDGMSNYTINTLIAYADALGYEIEFKKKPENGN